MRHKEETMTTAQRILIAGDPRGESLPQRQDQAAPADQELARAYDPRERD